MRIASYRDGARGTESARAAVVANGRMIDAAIVAEASGNGELISDWSSARSILDAGAAALEALDAAVESASDAPGAVVTDATLAPPIPDPRKIICLGLNYQDHATEAGLTPPSHPILFAKYATSLVGSGEPVVLPRISSAVDCEAELAVVVGRRCRDVAPSRVRAVLFGATAFNDVTARDVQLQTSQWTAGKAIDTFAPCGPSIVSVDEVGDLQDMAIQGRVNGAVLQDGDTHDMIFSVAEAISYISQLMTLEPGDIIATGTPAGVGFTRTPPVLLKHGDIIEVEIATIGILSNPVISAAVEEFSVPDPSDAFHISPRE